MGNKARQAKNAEISITIGGKVVYQYGGYDGPRESSGSWAIFAAIRRGSLLAIIDAISC